MATIPGILRTTAHTYPDKPAITFESKTMTYAEYNTRVDQLAAELIDRGVQKGDRVVLVAGNSDVFAIALYAGLRAGAIIAPVNPKSAGAEIEHFVTDSDARAIVFDAACADAVGAWAESFPDTAQKISACSLGPASFGEDILAAADARQAEEVEIGLQEDDDAIILYTSGTTGSPKGALFDHHRILWVSVNAISMGLRRFDRMLLAAPLYHAAALNILLFPGVMMAAHEIIHADFSPEAALDEFERSKITVFFGVPTMYAFMLRSPSIGERDLSHLRVGLFGAAPMPGSVAERLFDVFPNTELTQLCGQTEGGPGGILLSHEEIKINPAASGRYPIQNMEARVVDANGDEIEPGEVGELLIAGETVMKEYWRRPDATAATLVDRLKDMMITGGRNVYSAEVENALAAYPEISDIAVISRPHPDYGETVIAVVTPAEGGSPTLEGLGEFAKPLLAHYKIPRDLIIDDIPRNPSGKIQKHKLREKFANAS